MCANLVRAGYDVTAADAQPQARISAEQCGAYWCDDPADAAAGADLIVTVLPGPRELREVMAGSGGVLAGLPATATWIDMTSCSPAMGRALAADAHARGISVLDAPVGGGVAEAEAGTLQVFAGGDAAVLAQCRPVLEVLAGAGRIMHVGGNGAGYTAKLLVNLLWFSEAVVTAEALLIGCRAGIDLGALRQALRASAASSAFIEHDLDALLDGDYLTSFGLDRCCEELSAVIELARELGVPCELTEHVEGTYRRALKRYGPADGELLAVAHLEERAGLRLRHQPPAAAD
jgi:3-hydroxyisobutyrate dehydrogenase